MSKSDRRHPVVAVCLRCDSEYFNLGKIGTQCQIDDCGGYITGKTREEIKEYRKDQESE